MTSEYQGSTSVTAAFEILLEELNEEIDQLRNTAADAVRDGDYKKAEKFVNIAKDADILLEKVSNNLENWVDKFQLHLSANTDGNQDKDTLNLVMEYNGCEARATYDRNHVILLSGSKIMKNILSSLPDNYKELRNACIRKGLLEDSKHSTRFLILLEDLQFRSPSGAAQFVAGCSVSGNRDWHLSGSDKSLGDWLKTRPR